jgi:hypothetical protein
MKTIAKFFSEHQGRLLQLTLAGIMLLFIGIMIGVYIIAKRANPIILDEKGQPKFQQQQ